MIVRSKKLVIAVAASAAAAALGAGGSSAFGALSYKYATDVSNLSLSPGQVGSVNVYLVETVTGATASRLVSEQGLSSAYFEVAYVPPPSPAVGHAAITGVVANSVDFNDITGPDLAVAGDQNSGYVREYVDIAQPTGPSGTAVGTGVRELFLGSFTVVGGSSAGVTTFLVTDDPVTNDTVTIDGYATPLDAPVGGVSAIAPATFTVTANVPEPIAVLPAVAVLLGLTRSRPSRRG